MMCRIRPPENAKKRLDMRSRNRDGVILLNAIGFNYLARLWFTGPPENFAGPVTLRIRKVLLNMAIMGVSRQ